MEKYKSLEVGTSDILRLGFELVQIRLLDGALSECFEAVVVDS